MRGFSVRMTSAARMSLRAIRHFPLPGRYDIYMGWKMWFKFVLTANIRSLAYLVSRLLHLLVLDPSFLLRRWQNLVARNYQRTLLREHHFDDLADSWSICRLCTSSYTTYYHKHLFKFYYTLLSLSAFYSTQKRLWHDDNEVRGKLVLHREQNEDGRSTDSTVDARIKASFGRRNMIAGQWVNEISVMYHQSDLINLHIDSTRMYLTDLRTLTYTLTKSGTKFNL